VTPGGLRVLVVDDEAPARADLAWLLEREQSVASVAVASNATQALRALHRDGTDVVFLDVRMPGLHGLDLARVLGRFATPPQVVFVTAHEEHAVEAFELRACDYLLKPVRAERLREALARVQPPTAASAVGHPAAGPGSAPGDGGGGAPDAHGSGDPDDLAVLTVETAGRTRFVARQDVRYAEASGDYTRLHTADGAYLVRIPISALEAQWAPTGFFRVHRGYLVSLRAVTELRVATGAGSVVVVDGREVPVSRRHAREVKKALVRSRAGGWRRDR
jgi:two-component system LytT family response regulator